MNKEHMKAYWRKNIQYVLALLSIWFISSYGCGILFAEELNQFRMGGFKLGFWFAQQGAIYIFVILIFVYVYLMNRLDKEFDVDEKENIVQKDQKLADDYQSNKEKKTSTT